VKDITSKYSGYDWLGDIPRDWIISKNRYYFKHKKTGKNESNNTKVLSLTTKGVKVKENLSFGKSTESYIGHQMVEKGDIVFTPRDFDQTPILSDVSEFEGCISNLYIVDETDNRLLNYFLNYYWYGLKYSCDYFKNFSHGMRYSFNRFQFDEIPLLIPPVEEQQQITSFLDTKTSLIDSLIDKTQRKIELLKEKRNSLINEVVTKGLNPNVEMKDSGVEWIGDIPSHWDRVPLKYEIEILTDFTSNGSFKSLRENVEYLEEGFSRLVRLTDLRVNLENDGIFISEDSHNFLGKSELFGGEILISCVGHYTGFVTKMLFNKGSCSLGPNMYLIRNRIESSNVDYLIYLLNSDLIQSGLKNGINKTTQEKINKDNVKDLQIVRPPLSEQQQIVEYLDEQTQLIDNTTSIEEKRIELLKEYRQSLISEVVTGKKRVV